MIVFNVAQFKWIQISAFVL